MVITTKDLCQPVEGRGRPVSVASGRPFYPASPRAEEVHIYDIALQLSRICRFNGAYKRGAPIDNKWVRFGIMSVAQHSVNVEAHIPKEIDNPVLRLAALLHDA